MSKLPGLSDDDVKQLFADMLRMYVGQGRRFRYEDLAAAMEDGDRQQQEVRCLRSYVATDASMIPLAKALRVFAVLPPEALNMVLRPLGYAVKPLDVEGQDAYHEMLEMLLELSKRLAKALADGRVDHTEKAQELAPVAATLMPLLAAISVGAGRGQ